MNPKPGEITALLGMAQEGDKSAEQKLLDLVYRELKTIASRFMRRERANHTLQPTELVHEAYSKLALNKVTDWQSRAHFFAVAAKVMRRILVDYARARSAGRRGGDQVRVGIDEFLRGRSVPPETILAVSKALELLQDLDRRQCAIVEMRFFGGLTDEEIAQVLGISTRTVKRDWAFAKAWLYSQLK